MAEIPSILIVEDDVFQAELLKRFFMKEMQIVATIVEHGRAALDYLEDHHADIRLVMMDIEMPVMTGVEAMVVIKDRFPQLAVVFLSSHKDPETIVRVMQHGAFDYLTKPFDQSRLILTVRNAYRYGCLAHDTWQARWNRNGSLKLQDLVGYDGGLREMMVTAEKIAATDIPVLIGGETGVGKEVLARALHGNSKRSSRPFVAINCGAIPEHLIESILFGHEKGAFTGALEKTPGKFREAEGGTIFLDEIGEMPMAAQIRLLRVLQQHEVQPVGSTGVVPINVRVISATNKDLSHMVTRGRFREDLYFRLNVVPMILPPLRFRTHDILPLARHFIVRCAENEHYARKTLSVAAAETLVGYTWPGNVRELENAIRRALVLSVGDVLAPEDFQLYHAPSLENGLEQNRRDMSSDDVSLLDQKMLVSLLDDQGQVRSLAAIERDVIDHMHHYFKGNIVEIAKALKIARTTLYRKLNH